MLFPFLLYSYETVCESAISTMHAHIKVVHNTAPLLGKQEGETLVDIYIYIVSINQSIYYLKCSHTIEIVSYKEIHDKNIVHSTGTINHFV